MGIRYKPIIPVDNGALPTVYLMSLNGSIIKIIKEHMVC